MGCENMIQRLHKANDNFMKACNQLVILEERLTSLNKKYQKAKTKGQRSIGCSLRIRLTVVKGLHCMYHTYATKKVGEVRRLKKQIDLVHEHSQDEWVEMSGSDDSEDDMEM